MAVNGGVTLCFFPFFSFHPFKEGERKRGREKNDKKKVCVCVCGEEEKSMIPYLLNAYTGCA